MNADKIKAKIDLKPQMNADEHRLFSSEGNVSSGFIRVYLCVSVVYGCC